MTGVIQQRTNEGIQVSKTKNSEPSKIKWTRLRVDMVKCGYVIWTVDNCVETMDNEYIHVRFSRKNMLIFSKARKLFKPVKIRLEYMDNESVLQFARFYSDYARSRAGCTQA